MTVDFVITRKKRKKITLPGIAWKVKIQYVIIFSPQMLWEATNGTAICHQEMIVFFKH